MVKRISTSEGLWFGLLLLGQVTGVLAGTALLGWLADQVLNTAPIGLAVGVFVGSITATATVVMAVKKELAE